MKLISVNEICISWLYKFFNSFYFSVKGSQALWVKPSCFKCSSVKIFNNGILLNGVLIPRVLSKCLASCSCTNLDFLNPHSVHFDCIITLLFFVFKIFEFNVSGFFYTLCNKFSFSFIRFVSLKLLLYFLNHIFLQFHESKSFQSNKWHVLIYLLFYFM